MVFIGFAGDDISIRPGKKINIFIQQFFQPRTNSSINVMSTRSEVNNHAIEASRAVQNVIRAVQHESCFPNVATQKGIT